MSETGKYSVLATTKAEPASQKFNSPNTKGYSSGYENSAKGTYYGASTKMSLDEYIKMEDIKNRDTIKITQETIDNMPPDLALEMWGAYYAAAGRNK